MLEHLTINIPQLPSSLDHFVDNLLNEPTKEIGKIFSDCLNLAFGSIHFYASKKSIKHSHNLELFKESLQKNVSLIPAEKLVVPDERNLCQILDDSKYSLSDESLRESFSKLAAGTIHADKKNLSLPSFSRILTSLTPLDCYIFKIVMKNKHFPLIALCEQDASGNRYGTILEHISTITEFPYENVSLSLSILNSFGLINIPSIGHPVPPNLYELITESIEFNSFKNQKEKTLQIGHTLFSMHEGGVAKTPLGLAFYDTCCS